MRLIPKKSLGQHFLHSPHALEQIISAATIKRDETVLEIGPGTGILTRALLDAGARVMAVEKDARAYELLKGTFSKECGNGQLELVQGDILESQGSSPNASTPQTAAFKLPASGSYAIVANIPYYITGAILEKFLEHEPRPNRMILLVQKEVAERIIAAPSNKESILSISVKAFGSPHIVARVPRGAFVPPPAVDSAILEISSISDMRFAEKNLSIPRFFEIVRAGFAHKRKFLKRNLEAIVPADALENAWERLALDGKIRAEDMKLEQWFELAGLMV